MKFVWSFLFLCLSVPADASLSFVKVKARYVSRNGSSAKVSIGGKEREIALDRLSPEDRAKTGKIVDVVLYPEEMGLSFDPVEFPSKPKEYKEPKEIKL